MARPPERLKELRQYVEDLEVGVAMRLDHIFARLEANERDLAAIGKHLAPEGRADAGQTAASHSEEEETKDQV